MKRSELKTFRYIFEPGETVGALYSVMGEHYEDDLFFVKDGQIFVTTFGVDF